MTNRNMKYLLQPTINKFSTLRKVETKIKNKLMEIKMEFAVIVFTVYINYPLLYFVNSEWYDVLASTTQGHIATGIVALTTVICTFILVLITKPLKYKI